jgi:serine/threonine protein kinase
MIGKTIAHYKILEKLGEGGMGVVYKVQDTKLDRLLALKFLPPHLTVNETDKTRFLQEAKAAAAINHPNVCTIYDIKENEDRQFIVMEYVEGETLREYIGIGDSTPHKIKDIIEYALQIASALEAAHKEGIVHRDVKSENIMVSKTNQIKVMDFGLAKLKGSLKLTKTSSTVGTLAYMAPEQIEGKPTDARSDIFSFGVVLYEMLTGNLPFSGEYESALMYTILNDDPEPVENYRSDISSELVHVLNRALEKDPEDRYQMIHEVVIDLNRVKRDSSKVSRKSLKEMPMPEVIEEIKETATKIEAKRNPAYIIPSVIISILVLTIISLFIFNPFSGESLPPPKIVSFTSLPGMVEDPAFSADGKQLAFSWKDENSTSNDIYTKLIATGSRLKLTNHPGYDYSPIWSPDGNHIAFIRDFEEKLSIITISSLGGVEQPLHTLNKNTNLFGSNFSWSSDGKLLAIIDYDTTEKVRSIFSLSLDRLKKRKLTNPQAGYGDSYPIYSPDGKKLAFVRGPNFYTGNIYVMPLPSGEPEQITSDNSWIWGLAWTADSREIVYSSNREEGHSLWRIASGGKPISVQFGGESDLKLPAVSLKGQYLAYVQSNWNENIWRIDITDSTSPPIRLISSSRWNHEPQYSPDGNKIVFRSTRTGHGEIFVCDSDGKNTQRLTFLRNWSGAPSWSPDGKTIAFDLNIDGYSHIYKIPANGGHPEQITRGISEDHVPSWSRDGKWIYYWAQQKGKTDTWRITVNGERAEQITFNNGSEAFESFDGEWIYFRKAQDGIWKKPVQGGDEEMVIDDPVFYGQWTVVDDGIYYAYSTGIGDRVEFYNFKSGKKSKIVDFGKEIGWGPISVSFDRRWLLYPLEERFESNIILMKNFR